VSGTGSAGGHPFAWPRRRAARAVCRAILRVAFRLLARVEVSGREHLPAAGPLIVAGNHAGFLDVILMIAFGPPRLELIGTGDVPMDPSYAWIAGFYGFIPVNRGSTDRASLEGSLGVLRQGGFLGIFPQGGIWRRQRSPAQRGVAWLAAAAGVPVLPMGFGWRPGTFRSLLTLGFPRITVGIGRPVPPPTADGRDRRERMDAHAERIMDAIEGLIPADLRDGFVAPEREEFTAAAFTVAADGTDRAVALDPAAAMSLGFLFFHPVLIRTFGRNLGLRTRCLEDLAAPIAAPAVRDAVTDIVTYLDGTNPRFFSYRMGDEAATALRAAFAALLAAAADPGVERLRFVAERRWRMPGENADRIERLPGGAELHGER
jgi:1-acyl-sn-glycerol-3-phosphate acyltransferase